MTAIKLDSKLGRSATDALEPHVLPLYGRLGARIVAVLEFEAIERNQVAEDADKDAWVKLRITGMEIPTREQENALREAMRVLYLQRTAFGTLEEDGSIELSEDTLKHAAGVLADIEAAKLRAGVAHWAGRVRRTTGAAKDFTVAELLAEMRQIRDGLDALLDRGQLALEDA
ncbi:hypothetical protein SAMN04489712_105258 [Thermomonospora echinospora]|uniref:Uncharacterized protein n=1 Tax=Thermomonospora echinospora TaxID=1992 RepID=A0A1H6A756_9ACTN|nr:hypothetical protein [Thermomonospora echinospora]SEG44568.1 hypothetical protein SAMN04489712_105258 [Thermomonospora echinospora]